MSAIRKRLEVDYTETEIVDRIIQGKPVSQRQFAKFLKGFGKHIAGSLGQTNAQFRQGVINQM